MFQSLKTALKPLPGFREYAKAREERAVIQRWRSEGSPAPPPHIVKQRVVREYGRQFGTKTLIETGTFKGDMVFAARKTFERIYSIELGEDLYERAKGRFARFPHIKIVHGDSGSALKQILNELDAPALFWLDAHYSEGITARGTFDTPIRQELEMIFSHRIRGHVLLIDDARCFTGDNHYPSISELQVLVSKARSAWSFSTEHDIIRIHPS